MAHRPIIYDVTRLLTRLGRATPNGIDRVDMEYAQHFLSGGRQSYGALMGHAGIPRLLSGKTALAIANGINASWQEGGAQTGATPPVSLPLGSAASVTSRVTASVQRFLRDGRVTGSQGIWPGRSLVTEAPLGSAYLNISQFPIWRPRYLSWLDARPDIRAIFFLHDMLPITYPEFFRPFEVRRHLGRIEAIAARAAGIIVSGGYTQEALKRYLTSRKLPIPPIAIAPLQAASGFRRPAVPAAANAAVTRGRPYFVCVGTLEPRKNHLFLLSIWRELSKRLRERTPCLLLVGANGWESENVDDMLSRCDALQDTVFRLTGIPTPALAGLLQGSRALLMPTFAEGFGLPVAEAISTGVPVVASDIEVFRTIDSPLLTRIDPLDGLGWMDAIERHQDANSRVFEHPLPTLQADLDAPCLPSHIEDFISRLG